MSDKVFPIFYRLKPIIKKSRTFDLTTFVVSLYALSVQNVKKQKKSVIKK